MDGLNSVTIGGNLTRDAELRYTQAGTAVLSFTVAVNESRKKDDTWEDYPNFIDCTMFGKRAESVSDYLRKGVYAAITGKLHQNRWEKDGQSRSKIEVTVDNIHFESKGASGTTNGEASYSASGEMNGDGIYDEDIPF